MKLLPKFALLSFGVAAVPLAIAGLSSVRISRHALRESIQAHEELLAVNVARFVSQHLSSRREMIRLQTRVFARKAASKDVLVGLMRYLYHQSDEFSVLAAVDDHGNVIASTGQYEPRPNSVLGEHEAVDEKDVAALVKQIPIAAALEKGEAVGAVFPAGHAGNAHVVFAVQYEPLPDEPPIVLGALISLRRVHEYIAGLSLSGEERDVLLLDRQSRIVASGRDIGPPSWKPMPMPHAPPGALPAAGQILTSEAGSGAVIGAYAPAHLFPFGVVVSRPEREALSPVRRLSWATLFWIGVSGLVAAVVGAALARSLASRVGALAEGARRVAQGKLETQLEVPSKDELGDLAKTFNAMATSLAAARGEILRQTSEITAWNDTLEKRVEDKTKELREAQDLLLRSRSLAAIGSLGAGVAHEINNPLTGILGLTQLLLGDLPAEHPGWRMIKDVEDQALRIQSIVANLLRLAQRRSGEDFRPVDLGQVIRDAVELCGGHAFAEAGITLECHPLRPSPVVRGSAPLLQAALIQLIENARGATERGGRVSIETSVPEPRLVTLRLSDTGRGISPEHLPRIFDPFFTTKTRRTDTGIGLSVVHKIIEDHGGTIRVDSEVGRGTTFWITFPIDQGASHLP